MTYKTTLRLSFLSSWHIGSGLGNGAIADAVLNRDAQGLLWIPGTAIKGALREASWRLALCDNDCENSLGWLTEFFFGKSSDAENVNKPGKIHIGSGGLDKEISAWLLSLPDDQRKDFVDRLTTIRQQTRLNPDKTVVDGSLRSIECGIPGIAFRASLEARIEPDWTDWFENYLRTLCANVKSVGGYRSRGLGGCVLKAALRKTAPARVPDDLPASLLRHKPEKR